MAEPIRALELRYPKIHDQFLIKKDSGALLFTCSKAYRICQFTNGQVRELYLKSYISVRHLPFFPTLGAGGKTYRKLWRYDFSSSLKLLLSTRTNMAILSSIVVA